MKRTLKRELKVSEIVASDAFVVSVCLIFNFFQIVFSAIFAPFTGGESRADFGVSKVENGGLTSTMGIK